MAVVEMHFTPINCLYVIKNMSSIYVGTTLLPYEVFIATIKAFT